MDPLFHTEFDVTLQDNSDHTQCRPPQCKRILTPRWFFINRPEPDQRVEFICEGHGYRDGARWDGVARPLRFVMFLDGGGDGGMVNRSELLHRESGGGGLSVLVKTLRSEGVCAVRRIKSVL